MGKSVGRADHKIVKCAFLLLVEQLLLSFLGALSGGLSLGDEVQLHIETDRLSERFEQLVVALLPEHLLRHFARHYVDSPAVKAHKAQRGYPYFVYRGHESFPQFLTNASPYLIYRSHSIPFLSTLGCVRRAAKPFTFI